MKKDIYISDLPGYYTQQIEDLFFIRELTLKQSASQTQYLSLFLQDKTGTIGGIMWQEYIKEEFMELKGHVVKVKGMIIQNQKEQYEILLTSLELENSYDQGEYVNGLTPDETKKYQEYLQSYIKNVKEDGYRILLQTVFDKEMDTFATLPVTLKGHHSYNGGLLVHTITVTSLARYMSRTLDAYNYHPSYHIPFNSSLLVTSSLLHAIGIVRMLTPFPELKRDKISILLSQHEHTMQYLQETFRGLEEGVLSEEEKSLLMHTIGCVYESTERKPMLREALLLRESYQILINVANLEYFINCHDGEEGSVFDSQLNNYVYVQSVKKEDLNE